MKYLLGEEVCSHCGGFGVFRAAHPDFRVRVKFPDHEWEILDETYSTIDDAEWTAVEMKVENRNLECEIVSPTGEIISV